MPVALAEGHDLTVRLALRVEVRAALAAADGKAGEGVLEDLFEAEELDDSEIDAGVEAEASLVGADGAVELDAVAAVDLYPASVVDPCDTEHDLSLRLNETIHDASLKPLRMLCHYRLDGLENLADCLVELGLPGVPGKDAVENWL